VLDGSQIKLGNTSIVIRISESDPSFEDGEDDV